MTEAAKLIVSSALEFLAKKHSVEVGEIVMAYAAGAPAVVAQVDALILAGINVAVEAAAK